MGDSSPEKNQACEYDYEHVHTGLNALVFFDSLDLRVVFSVMQCVFMESKLP